MATQSIPPLRVQKGSNNASPNKTTFLQNRPLSELSPMAIRRNSPSFPRASLSKHESSPVSSPFNASSNSPRMFWNARDPISPGTENKGAHDPPVSPSKRSSIENLKRASRVRNSNIFEIEQKNNYNPSQPSILDGKPLGTSIQGNAFGRASINSLVTVNKSPVKAATPIPSPEPVRTASIASSVDGVDVVQFNPVVPLSPSKSLASPTKSSLSKKTGAKLRRSGFDPTTGIWEDNDDEEKILPEGKGLHRHAKSVTFDHAPPQINEYEMATPDPSSIASGSREGSYESFDDENEEMSFERGSSVDVDDSFDASLEDTEKTPVVLPEDWRFLSPETARKDLVQAEDDVFNDNEVGSPAPTARPGSSIARPIQSSTTSVDSSGQPRALPPLPMNVEAQRDSLSGTMERLSGTYRALPTPPPPTILSKEDVRRMSNGTLSLEDRMLLMQVKDNSPLQNEVDNQRERRMRRGSSRESSPLREQFRVEAAPESVAPLSASAITTTNNNNSGGSGEQLNRESILRQLREDDDVSRSDSQRSIYSQASFDPDTPIPSREDPTQVFEDEEVSEIVIKQEPVDDDELYAIPDLYSRKSSAEGSHYSTNSSIQHSHLGFQPGQLTPRATSPAEERRNLTSSGSLSLPEFQDFGRKTSFDFGFVEEHDTKEPSLQLNVPKVDMTQIEPPIDTLPDLAALRQEITRPFTPDEPLQPPKAPFVSFEEDVSEPGTPSSVIHHPVRRSTSFTSNHEEALVDEHYESARPPPVPPKFEALTLPQITPANEMPPPPPPPQREEGTSRDVQIDVPATVATDAEPVKRDGKRLSSLVQLDLPREESGDDLGLSLETEFDRVLETQKRGYLMRQNTKVVIATERMSHDEPQAPQQVQNLAVPEHNEVVASPRNVSQPTWTAEPWNNKSRRKSLRLAGEEPSTKRKEAPAPPLPGQTSALGAVAEDELAEEEAEELEDGAERGRLFIKVVGVKDLQLPFPKRKPTARSLGTLTNEVEEEKSQFTLTLDNGLHCVTTAWLDLAKSAPIGQEFELVVLNELEFQLTLQMKLEEPKPPLRAESPTKPPVSPKKQSTFGRLFASPKKRKESDVAPVEPRRPVTPPSAYELVQGLVAKDGSFARAYVSLAEFEKQAFGRPCTVDIGCFNEWATEEVPVGSSRSKKGAIQLRCRPPYEIGKLELQLLYVPKPKGVKDEDMPKSMNGAVRAMREAEEKAKQQVEIKSFEGFLSQQGGDCPYWRRRFFKLSGAKLTAYHETTRQPRATINLAKATKLIDDKANLTKKEASSRGGKRRKSAFADDEEGYMFVEEGFRLRFANGEMIDFYAENALAKDEWMAALSQVVGKNVPSAATQTKSWTDVVLKREKSVTTKSKAQKSSKELPKQQATNLPPVMPATPIQTVEVKKPQLEKAQQHLASGAIQPLLQQSSTARPHAHVRGESYQVGLPRSKESPVKPRVSQAERHRKTMSMWA